jgi:hypothetical protein
VVEYWVAGIHVLTEVDAVVDAARLGVRPTESYAQALALLDAQP